MTSYQCSGCRKGLLLGISTYSTVTSSPPNVVPAMPETEKMSLEEYFFTLSTITTTSSFGQPFAIEKICEMDITASLSAVFRSQKGTKLLHTSGACPGDGSHYY